jgi:hypothetical protein
MAVTDPSTYLHETTSNVGRAELRMAQLARAHRNACNYDGVAVA